MEAVLDNIELSDEDFRLISELVYKHCGINLHTGKKGLVRARLAKRLHALRIGKFSEYVRYAVKDPTGKEFTTLIDSLSTNLTGHSESLTGINHRFSYVQPTIYAKP